MIQESFKAAPIDPTTFSTISEFPEPLLFSRTIPYTREEASGTTQEVRNVYKDLDGGEWYELLADRFPVGQMFFARLLKPLIGVCDISMFRDAQGNAHYVSKAENHTAIKSDTAPFVQTPVAPGVFFRRILKDIDRARNSAGIYGPSMDYDFEYSVIFCFAKGADRSDAFYTARIGPLWEKRFKYRRDQVPTEFMKQFADLNSANITNDLSTQYITEFPDIIRANLENMRMMLQAFITSLEDVKWFEAVVASLPIPLSKAIYFPPRLNLKDEREYSEYARNTLLNRARECLKVVNAA